MFHSNDLKSDRGRLATSIKAAALVVVIGVLAVLIEQQPLRFALSPGPSHAATSTSLVARTAPERAEQQLPASASEAPAYFPSRFAPPAGEIEEQPPTF